MIRLSGLEGTGKLLRLREDVLIAEKHSVNIIMGKWNHL